MTQPSLLITRPHDSATRFVARLAQDIQQSTTIVISPLLEIVPTEAQPDLSKYQGVIFTSSNAVDLASNGHQKPAYCVGNTTAIRARAVGWKVCAEELTAEHLIAQMKQTAPIGPLLHLAGKHRRGNIAERLTALGMLTDVCVLYDQEPIALSAKAQALLNGESPVVVPLFSPRSAAHFIDQAAYLHNVTIIAMSDAVAQCCQELGAKRILVAAAPTGLEMLRSVEKAIRNASLA